MVSLARGAAAAAARSGASSRWCSSSRALYYGVHIGEVYLRYYRLLDAMRFQAQHRAQLTDDAVIDRRLIAAADSILGQTPRFRIDRGGRRRITIQTEYSDRVELPFFKHTFRAPPPRRSAALGSRAARLRRRRRRRLDRSPRRRAAGWTSRGSSSCWPRFSWRPSSSASWPNGSGSRPCSASCSPACCWAAACSGSCPPADAEAELIHVLAELGVLLLLFEIGLETDLREMFRVGPAGARGRAGRRRAAVRLRLPLLALCCRMPPRAAATW